MAMGSGSPAWFQSPNGEQIQQGLSRVLVGTVTGIQYRECRRKTRSPGALLPAGDASHRVYRSGADH